MQRLHEANMQDLSEIYDAIYQDHKGCVTYTFSVESLALYNDFDKCQGLLVRLFGWQCIAVLLILAQGNGDFKIQ